jgi:hypothetical protein
MPLSCINSKRVFNYDNNNILINLTYKLTYEVWDIGNDCDWWILCIGASVTIRSFVIA